jgi:hypothetical protein
MRLYDRELVGLFEYKATGEVRYRLNLSDHTHVSEGSSGITPEMISTLKLANTSNRVVSPTHRNGHDVNNEGPAPNLLPITPPGYGIKSRSSDGLRRLSFLEDIPLTISGKEKEIDHSEVWAAAMALQVCCMLYDCCCCSCCCCCCCCLNLY